MGAKLALLPEAEPAEEEGPVCETCNGTRLVPGTRLAYEAGVWIDVPTKYRATCPACRAPRETPDEGL